MNCRLIELLNAFIEKHPQTVFTSDNNILSSRASEVSNLHINAGTFANTGRAVCNDIFVKLFTIPCEIVEPHIIMGSWITIIMRSIPFSCDEFGYTVTGNIRPNQFVVLGSGVIN